MLINTDDEARTALEEVGQLQQLIDADEVDFDMAGDQMVERLNAVMDYYPNATNLYEIIVEPIGMWAVQSLGPHWIVDQDSTSTSRRYKALWFKIREFTIKYEHLAPQN